MTDRVMHYADLLLHSSFPLPPFLRSIWRHVILTTCSYDPSWITKETIDRLSFFIFQINPRFDICQIGVPSSTSLSIDLDDDPTVGYVLISKHEKGEESYLYLLWIDLPSLVTAVISASSIFYDGRFDD